MPFIDRAPWTMAIAREAFLSAGIEPAEVPIRGGTDGARLSAQELPCPNIFTGGLNFHSIYECLPVKSLFLAEKAVLEIVRRTPTVRMHG